MARHLSTRIRLNPDPAQEVALRQIAGCCRLVYNLGREQRRDFWRQYRAAEGRSLHWMGQKKELPALKEAAPFLADAPAHCLQMALQDLQRAFDNFYAGRAGYPQPRRKYEDDSFRFPDPAQIRVDPRAGLLVLPKFGRRAGDHGAIRAVFHRPIRGRIRSVTVSREGRHWYASILLERREKAARPDPAPITAADVCGIDRGTVVPFMDSEGLARGHAILPARGSGEAKRRRRLEQALARAKKGSKRRAKVRLKLAAHRAREARRRRDMIEKVT
ncbi:RNA-guided endonuclease InsQ/TnpB family protein, partial [Cereibacter sphaeroides]